MVAGSGLVVTPAARGLKRQVGPRAWAVLEDVLLDVEDHDGVGVAETSVRRVAEHLGVTKDTAARGLARLIDAGLLVREQCRDERGFSRSLYLVDLSGVVGVTLGPSVRPDSGNTPEPTCPTNEDKACRPSPCPEIADTMTLRPANRDAVSGRRPTNRDAEPPEDVPPDGRPRRRPSRRSPGRERPAQNALFDLDSLGVDAYSGARAPRASAPNHPATDAESESALRNPSTTTATSADGNLNRVTASCNQIENLVNRRSDAITAGLDSRTPKAFTHWHPAVPPIPSTVPSTGDRRC